jgi:hypothetical protein
MSTRMIRTLALAVGAGALVLGAAAPAMAVTAPTPVTTLPANVKIATDGSIALNVANAAVCAATPTEFKAFSPGKQDAVTTSASCSGTTLVGTVTPTASKKKNAVVKFTSTVNGEKVVQTLVVHVNRAKPGNGNKPA